MQASVGQNNRYIQLWLFSSALSSFTMIGQWLTGSAAGNANITFESRPFTINTNDILYVTSTVNNTTLNAPIIDIVVQNANLNAPIQYANPGTLQLDYYRMSETNASTVYTFSFANGSYLDLSVIPSVQTNNSPTFT